MEEIWKIVPSAPGIMASSFGRVCLLPTMVRMPNGAMRRYEGKPTFGVEDKTATARHGSPKRKIIRVNRMGKTFKVHQLICEAFHGPKPFPEAIVMHKNENPSVNTSDNLEWGTRKQNQNAPLAVAAFKARTGESSPWAIHQRSNPK